MRGAIRHAFELCLGMGLVLALAAPVAAAKPDRSFAEAGDIPVIGYCDFDVIERPVSDNEYFTTFFDADGNVTRSHVAGRLVLELINVETGHSIVVNASGPGRFVDDADGTTVLTGGTWILSRAKSPTCVRCSLTDRRAKRPGIRRGRSLRRRGPDHSPPAARRSGRRAIPEPPSALRGGRRRRTRAPSRSR